MDRKIVLITGVNGSGKTSLTRKLIELYFHYPANVFEKDRWEVLKIGSFLSLLVGPYKREKVIAGMDLYKGPRIWEAMGKALENPNFHCILVEAQKLGYGERFLKLLKMSKKHGSKLHYVFVDINPLEAWERLKKRGYYPKDPKKDFGPHTLMFRSSIMKYWHDTFPQDRRLYLDFSGQLSDKIVEEAARKVAAFISE